MSDSQRSLTSQVARGSVWTVFGQMSTLAVGFLLTPVTIRLLGPDAYGAYLLTTILTSYFAAADLGLGMASGRFCADALARGDDEREARAVATALSITVASTALAMLGLSAISRHLVVAVFRVPTWLQAATIGGIWLAACAFVLRSAAAVLRAPLYARLQMGWITVVGSGGAVLQTATVVAILLSGGGVLGACLGGVLAASCQFLGFGLLARRAQPRVLPPHVDTRLFLPLLRFGGPTTVSALVGMVIFQGERFMLARGAPVADLGYYGVAFALAQLVDVAPVAMAGSLFPGLARVHAVGERGALEELYALAVRGVAMLVLPASVLIGIAGRPFLEFWAGPTYAAHSWAPLMILLVGGAANSMAHVPRTLLPALGRPDLVARIHIAQLIPYLVLGPFLVSSMGVVGAAVCWAARAIVECIWVFRVAHRSRPMSSWGIIGKRRPAWLAIVGLSVLSLAAAAVMPQPGILWRAGMVSAYVACYVAIAWTRLLGAQERSHLSAIWAGNRGSS
jgi:O-antigen/teichoic acid export membrane protein